MKHLTVDEMIDFVSINKLDDESLKLASVVSAHILQCDICRKKVEAFQIVYDELIKMTKNKNFSNIINKKVIDNEKNSEKQFDNFK